MTEPDDAGAQPRRGGFPLSWSAWTGGEWWAPRSREVGTDAGPSAPGIGDTVEALQKVIGAAVDATRDLGPVAPHLLVDQLIAVARDRLVGRQLTMRRPTGAVRFVLHDIDAHPSALGLAVGQLGDISVSATDVVGLKGRADRVDVRFRNVHISPGTTPVLVSAPVDAVITVGGMNIAELAATRRPNVAVTLDDDGVATVGSARHRLGRAEIVPRLEGRRVRFLATGVRLGGRRIGFGRGVPTIAVDVPPMPSGFRPDDIVLDGASVVITGAIDELRRPLALGQLQDLLRRMRAAADDQFEFADSDPEPTEL